MPYQTTLLLAVIALIAMLVAIRLPSSRSTGKPKTGKSEYKYIAPRATPEKIEWTGKNGCRCKVVKYVPANNLNRHARRMLASMKRRGMLETKS